jgi:hypothetical protein
MISNFKWTSFREAYQNSTKQGKKAVVDKFFIAEVWGNNLNIYILSFHNNLLL